MAGNLLDLERGWWFIWRLPTDYRRHIIEKTGAIADKPSTLVFKKLKEAIKLKIMAAEGAK